VIRGQALGLIQTIHLHPRPAIERPTGRL
jgi:hypothetical protein